MFFLLFTGFSGFTRLPSGFIPVSSRFQWFHTPANDFIASSLHFTRQPTISQHHPSNPRPGIPKPDQGPSWTRAQPRPEPKPHWNQAGLGSKPDRAGAKARPGSRPDLWLWSGGMVLWWGRPLVQQVLRTTRASLEPALEPF